MGPGHSRCGIRSRAVILIFPIAGRPIAVRIIPGRPAFRPDEPVDITVYVQHIGKWPPRPSQGSSVYRSVAGEHAIIKNKSIGMLLRSRGCRYMRVLLTVYMAFVKPGGSCSEDEIGGAFYITILIILAALLTVEEEDVLVADDPAIAEPGPFSLHFQGYGLTGRGARVIAESDIKGGEI